MLNRYNLENQHIFCKRADFIWTFYKYVSTQTRVHYLMTLRRQERGLLTLHEAFCSSDALSVLSKTLKSQIYHMVWFFFLLLWSESSKTLNNTSLLDEEWEWCCWRVVSQRRTYNPWQPGGEAIHHLPCPLLIWGGNNLKGCLCESVRTKAALTSLNPAASGNRAFTAPALTLI